MFGGKLRSWMEAHIVRPRKKGARKGAQPAAGPPELPPNPIPNDVIILTNADICKHSCSSGSGGSGSLEAMSGGGGGSGGGPPSAGGAASLSSPESAYSTGYSTDGTSPGASFPPEYYINIRTGTHYFQAQAGPQPAVPQPQHYVQAQPAIKDAKRFPVSGHRRSESCGVAARALVGQEEPPPPSCASPRQRSRIRTNPWLGGAGGAVPPPGALPAAGAAPPQRTPLPACKEMPQAIRSPYRMSPTVRSPRRVRTAAGAMQAAPVSAAAPTASSSSSGSRHSSEDDLTLHEMMGKYDESYVYERETDILSDSDPTDCEDGGDTDADTGLDGGDEQDPEDLDFIDKDSFLDLNLSDTERGPRRLGHSNYYHFPNELSRRLSRHNRESSARRGGAARKGAAARPRAPRRRRQKENAPATRSLGGTPLALRRQANGAAPGTNEPPINRRSPASLARRSPLPDPAILDIAKRRCNSIGHVSRNSAKGHVTVTRPEKSSAELDSEVAMMEADREADRKYRELIMEAEHILVTMKASTPLMGSPRRVLNNPPANKRVELLRNAEIDIPKIRTVDLNTTILPPSSPKPHASPRFSPKKNHITNFMQINSPELSRREPVSVNENLHFSSPKKLLVHAPPLNPKVAPIPQEPLLMSSNKCPNSPAMARRCISPVGVTPVLNGCLSTPKLRPLRRSPPMNSSTCMENSSSVNIDDDSDESTEKIPPRENLSSFKFNPKQKFFLDRRTPVGADSQSGDSSSFVGGTSSSSDGDGEKGRKEEVVSRERAPLLTFRSIDVGNTSQTQNARNGAGLNYCPQSEPVKRKVYSCSASFDRLQKSLEPYHLARQKSDGEGTTDEDRGTDECRAGLRQKVERLKAERMEAERIEVEETTRQKSDMAQQGAAQRQLSLVRRQMLLQTIEGLKRSLEDQSASLQQTYHEPGKPELAAANAQHAPIQSNITQHCSMREA